MKLINRQVTREDTVVVFYLEENNTVVWEEAANTILVHKQVAIAFETPAFRDPRTSEHVTVRYFNNCFNIRIKILRYPLLIEKKFYRSNGKSIQNSC